MKSSSKQSNGQPSFLENYAFAKCLPQFVALTVMVLMRKNIGYRILSPLKLIVVNGLLAVFGILSEPGNEDARPIALTIFATVSFCAGISQRFHRWRELGQPNSPHSEYVGDSPFDWQFLPAFMRRNSRMGRFADPIACTCAGILMFNLSHALGCYLIFAGLCLRLYSHQVFERQRERNLDLSDGLLMAQYQSEVVEQYEGTTTPQPGQSRPGIPTGLGADLKANLQRRDSARI
jgi:hypothetical protein